VATAFELTIVGAGMWLAWSDGIRPALSSRLAWVVSGVALVVTSVGLLSVLEVVRP
jgi:uncharacterized membrane protein